MKTTQKIEWYLNRIEAIRYENENGGAYAYIQYLAYMREILTMLRPIKRVEKQLDLLEGINWLFNEHLAFKFTPRHKAIFEEKIYETKQIFKTIRAAVQDSERFSASGSNLVHAQAA